NILHAMADQSRMIRLPLNKVALSNRIQKAQSMLEQQLERTPSSEELADVLDIDIEEINQSISHRGRHVSLDTPFSDDENSSLLDTYENTNAERTEGDMYHADSLKQELTRSFVILTEKQKQTLCCFFGIGRDHPMSLDDIAQKMDVTPERVRQIKDKAISKLRTIQNNNSLRSFLGT
ncbi:MAG: RNA polymerase subunit sigma, partial [Bacteroidia bacterium]|nr:RNA polymerase subunit sigma [Bacteroidia bacterium]